MCGRYRRTTSEEELARRYHIQIPRERDLPISWNIAPTQDVLAIRLNPESKQRTLDTLRWGLIPNWAKDPKIAYKTINARAETVDTAPSYKQAFLPEERHDSWLSSEAGKEILVSFPADRMKAWPISSRVNSPKNNDADIILPIELQSVS